MVVADATERASKIKFWSPDEKHIVHKAWDECSHVEQNWIRERQPERVPDDASDQRVDLGLVVVLIERQRQVHWNPDQT